MIYYVYLTKDNKTIAFSVESIIDALSIIRCICEALVVFKVIDRYDIGVKNGN